MHRLLMLVLLLWIVPKPGRAQISESPLPFDTAGRIISVNEALAARLGLTAPAWPVTGKFVEARLYRSSDGSQVLVVQRASGVNERYPLTSDQLTALRAEFSAATDRVGRVVVEDAASTIAEPARGAFVRDQMLLASIIYGPALASLTDDGSTGTGVYLLSVGGTFFALTNATRHAQITKAENSLSTDGALRGWAASGLLANAANLDLGGHGGAITALTGGIGGSIIGFQRGRNLTNSEAQAAMTGSTLAAGAMLGVAGTVGLVDENNGGRAASTALLIGGTAGYLWGPLYPRTASYTVTAGDIDLVRLSAILGTLVALTPIVGNNVDGHLAAGMATAGWVGGALIGDRVAAKPFNHSSSDARMIQLGALGGALMASAFPIMAKSENATFDMGIVTAGAIAGAVLAHGMMDPPRQGTEYVAPREGPPPRRLEFDPQGLAMTLTKQQGNHTLLRITF